MSVDYRVLGPVEVWNDGRRVDIGGDRQRRLFGALLLANGRPVAADRLVEIVFAGKPTERARDTLRTYVARARRALELGGDAPLVTAAPGWALERPADSLDCERFEGLLETARSLARDPSAALTCLDEALALWRGQPYEPFEDEEWCAGEAARLTELRVTAEEERVDALLACGLHADAIGELDRLISAHPVRDRLRGQRMIALYRAGRQVDALRAYHDYRRLLRDEVGLEPSDELRVIERRILDRDPSLQPDDDAGRAVRGYRLGKRIGEDAVTTTYLARQPQLGREVAITVVRTELADDADFVRRFDRDIRSAAAIDHPHVVPIVDYWREPGAAYVVTRRLRGGTAADLVATRGPLQVDRVSEIVTEIGSALAVAHAAGIAHGDVTLADVVFDDQGRSHLAGLGIRRLDAFRSGTMSATDDAVAADLRGLANVCAELLGASRSEPAGPTPDAVRHAADTGALATAVGHGAVPPAVADFIERALTAEPGGAIRDAGEFVTGFWTAAGADDGPDRRPPPFSTRNPYKGLAAFDESDAPDFFGREREARLVVQRLDELRFVALVGPSGAGKSSLVRAGVVPALRARGDFVVTMVPGRHPLQELTMALLQVAPAATADSTRRALRDPGRRLATAVSYCLPDPDGRLVLIVDQFEELFTQSTAAERDVFLDSIADAIHDQHGRVLVLATVRADMYDRPLAHIAVHDLVRAGTVPLSPLAANELERAVVEPATRLGVDVERPLVARLIADVAGAPSALPLIEYELTHLFDRREGAALTLEAYERDGGVIGAVARRADDVFDRLDERERSETRRLFQRLVTLTDDDVTARRRVLRSELAGVSDTVIDEYGAARLLAFDRDVRTREPTVELAHEALILEWPRLRRWIEDDRDGLRTLRHLTATAAAWETSGREDSELYRGGRLANAEEWATDHDEELTATEREFLAASGRVRNLEAQREHRRVRRLHRLVGALAVVATVAAIAGVVAVRARASADAHAQAAERRATENQIARLAGSSALARATADPDLAILLALAASDVAATLGREPTSEVTTALHTAVQASRLERRIPAGYAEIGISPDGRLVALDHADETHHLGVYSVATGELVVDRYFDDPISGPTFSPDGSLLAVGFCCDDDDLERAGDPAMLLVDPSTLATVHELDGGLTTWNPSWRDDGEQVMAVNWQGARVWTVGRGEPDFIVTDAIDAAFVPGTDTIAVLASGRVDVVDPETGATETSHAVAESTDRMRVSPDGSMVALADWAGRSVDVVELGSGVRVRTIGHASPQDLRFSPDGTMLSIAGNSDAVTVVDLESGDEVELRGHGSGSWRHGFTPDGERMVTTSRDGGALVWSLDPAGPAVLGNVTLAGPVRNATGTPDGTLVVASQTEPNVVRIEDVDLTDGTRRTAAEFHFEVWHRPVISADGALVAGYTVDGLVPTVVDVATGEQIATLRPCETPRAVDGTHGWVLVDGVDCPDAWRSERAGDPRSGFIDLAGGERLASVTDPNGVLEAVVGHPDAMPAGVVVFHTGTHLEMWSAASLEPIVRERLPDEVRAALSIAVSPDGNQVGLSSQDRIALVYDVDAILGGAPVGEATAMYEETSSGPTHRVVPVGDTVATSGSSTEIRLWDAASGAMLADVPTASVGPSFLFAMPGHDGVVFYMDADNVLRRLLVDSEDRSDLARARLQRDFTTGECDRFFPDDQCPTLWSATA